MTEPTTLRSLLQAKSRSLGVKLFVVCVLAVFMIIPALLVYALVEDRTQRAKDVVKEIGEHVGGPQTFLGPTLAVPYVVPRSAAEPAWRGVYLIFPAQGSATLKIATEERRRSLFKVPVFQSDAKFDAAFDLSGVPASLSAGSELDWSRAQIIVGVSDARGALADATIEIGDKKLTLAPAEVFQNMTIGADKGSPIKLTLFGVGIAGVVSPGSQFKATATLNFSGAQRIAVLAYGRTSQVHAQGDWPSPGFDGGFLPVSRSISASGFSANWSVPFIARGVRAEGSSDAVTGLDGTALGVSFVEVADPYQSVNRSLKYVPLFLGLVFLSYFIFEATTGKRVHPAQYVLVGAVQIIFYLLLLSVAERIGFDLGFLVAGAATVGLLSFNAAWIFSAAQGLRAAVVFGLLYCLIYLLLRLEDNSLLVGAVASFLAVAAVMYFTRKIDWYSSLAKVEAPGTPQQRTT